MKPSSAMALVSAMPGAAMPFATSFFSACAMGSPCLPHPATSVVAAMSRRTKCRRFEKRVFIVVLLRTVEWQKQPATDLTAGQESRSLPLDGRLSEWKSGQFDAAETHSFDHFIRAQQQRWGNGQTDRLG